MKTDPYLSLADPIIILPTETKQLTIGIRIAQLGGYDSAAYQPAVVDKEYEDKVKALSQMLTKTKDEMDAVKAIADELKGIKLAKPTSGGIPLNVDHDIALKASLDAARTASEEFGKDSIEAKLAWETVEEVAASASDSEATRAPRECSFYLLRPGA